MEDDEPIECSACLAEPDIDIETNEPVLSGWKLDGEFGPTCPECTVPVEDASVGLDGIAAALGATKGENMNPEPDVGIEFSQQVNPGPFGGCVDPPFTEPYVPEEPKPDVLVLLRDVDEKKDK